MARPQDAFLKHPLPWRWDPTYSVGETAAIRDANNLYVMAAHQALGPSIVAGVNLLQLSLPGVASAMDLAKLIGLHPAPWRVESDPQHPREIYIYDAKGGLVEVDCTSQAPIVCAGRAAAVNLAHSLVFGKEGAA